jgi:hypothetical protein
MKYILFFIVLAISIVAADAGDEHMMDGFYDNMMSGVGFFGIGILWLIYIAIASFIFSVIFWLTHNMIAKKK